MTTPADGPARSDGLTVIVGALTPIGEAVCRRLCAHGLTPRLVLVDYVREALESLRAELARSGADVTALCIRSTSDDDWAEVVFDEVNERFGPVRNVLCAAHDRPNGSLSRISLEGWAADFDESLRKPWQLARAAARRLSDPKGSLVALGAPSADTIRSESGVASVCQVGLSFLIRALALELAERGSRANVVLPGDPEDTARTVEFLFSESGGALSAQNLSVRAAPMQSRTSCEAPLQAEEDPPASGNYRARLIVSGGAGGIAKALCRSIHVASLSRGGPAAAALLVDLDDGRLQDAARELRSIGITVETLTGDISDPTIPTQAVQRAELLFGGIDTVFSNAGVGIGAPVSQISVSEFDRCFNVNLRAAWLLAQAARRPLGASRGSFIATASIGALAPGLSAPVYSASKAALIRLTEQLALEWAPSRVRVNCVSPGSTLTSMNRLWGATAEERARQVARYPFKRMAEPDEIGAAMAFLAGPDAGYITGHNLVVDGGLSL